MQEMEKYTGSVVPFRLIICMCLWMILQSDPLICTSVISTLRLFTRLASSPVWVYAMSVAVNFAL